MKKEIIKVLTYFDLFKHPATAYAVYQHIVRYNKSFRLYDCLQALDELVVEKKLVYKHGLYAMAGKEIFRKQYQARVYLVEQKMKKAVQAIQILRYIPFIQAVFVCNTVAAGWPSKKSDIDVFVVVEKNRIWIARLYATFVLQLLRVRRGNKKICNRICLSFYCVEDALCLAPIALTNDIYLEFWISQLLPVYDPYNIYSKIQAMNTWSYAAKNITYISSDFWRNNNNFLINTLKKFQLYTVSPSAWNTLNRYAALIQKIYMKRNKKSVLPAADTRVIVSDSMLKFHENDRREQYKNAWEKTYKKNIA